MREQILKDMVALAIQRVERAVNSVTQLGDDREAFVILIECAGSLAVAAAGLMQKNSRDKLTGEPPSEIDARGHALSCIADTVGFDGAIVDTEEHHHHAHRN